MIQYFPPLAVLYRGCNTPFRIYEGEGIVLFLSQTSYSPAVVYDMTNAIVEWMERNRSHELITFNSMVVREKSQPVAGAGNSQMSFRGSLILAFQCALRQP